MPALKIKVYIAVGFSMNDNGTEGHPLHNSKSDTPRVLAMATIPPCRRKMQQYCIKHDPMPKGAIVANLDKQKENNSYDVKAYYVDTPFTCMDCSKREIWTAKQQQWWYEVAKGEINSTAVRCRACRQKLRDEKDAQKKHMEEMALKKTPQPE